MTERANNEFPPLPDNPVPDPPHEAAAESVPADPVFGSPPDAPSAFAVDPISYPAHSAETAPPPYHSLRLPDDLRISWSWVHLLFFLLSGFASAEALPLLLAICVLEYRHQPLAQVQQLAANATFLVTTQVLIFGAIMFFLYITLGVLRDAPFWSTVGWKRLIVSASGRIYKPWMFPLLGGGLAILVAVGSSRVKDAENAPIEQLFKDPHAAFLLMAMAVLVAPLVEETVFRGYLYPLFASSFAKVAAHYGVDSGRAVGFGTVGGVLLTGFLFGLLHGWQLGWNVTLVSLLTLVGVLFTFARAATGTVLASFLMHLGYNSLLAVVTTIATKGFTVAPPGH